ncbi:aminotransferase class I/II-fold pyridoxal phosphate-dependent enzyme [Pedobacter sp. HMF7647]|uniref:Aminotransferase class I/II-fold pyridoxal phosphate-dependent enzyme n=1 Tax=Hufsiella arboris TaxID=2695275 RepID=A0A7K1YCS9_9SPHI|nr:aminotransferase class I/II-fold pyridoxal phosphate-dependent enzyme [Hufsiella arboris]MXV52181.1 aminotransferase class I/II-fold pyridoxal phosphate-dependent enzyme [Hufsiella arboris]
MKLETIAIHSGNRIDETTKAAIQPITLSTTFERGADGDYPGGYIYTRSDNPNRASLEDVLAKLENGADACAFSSGNAAGGSVFQALKPGSHVIAPSDMYHGLRNLLLQVYQGILTVDFVDQSAIENIKAAIKPETRLIWIETPSNPLLKITDIRSITKLAKEQGIFVCCDNTFATPVLQSPLLLDADLVMHSTTKYLGGHSDVLGGALITKEKSDFWQRIRDIQGLSGAVPSPFDCYMTVRGIKTLPYRMKGHVENAQKLAEFLSTHDDIEAVFYPGLPSHENHSVAASQMNGFGGMLSFLVKGDEQAAKKVANATKIFTQATSLGGVESLIEHRASVEGPDTKTPVNLLRVSVGLENIDDLVEDISLAIRTLKN